MVGGGRVGNYSGLTRRIESARIDHVSFTEGPHHSDSGSQPCGNNVQIGSTVVQAATENDSIGSLVPTSLACAQARSANLIGCTIYPGVLRWRRSNRLSSPGRHVSVGPQSCCRREDSVTASNRVYIILSNLCLVDNAIRSIEGVGGSRARAKHRTSSSLGIWDISTSAHNSSGCTFADVARDFSACSASRSSGNEAASRPATLLITRRPSLCSPLITVSGGTCRFQTSPSHERPHYA
jgi:hypothetical protein